MFITQKKDAIKITTDQISVLGYYANSADPGQTPPNAASDQGLHCLFTRISLENAAKSSKTRNGLIQMIAMDTSIVKKG